MLALISDALDEARLHFNGLSEEGADYIRVRYGVEPPLRGVGGWDIATGAAVEDELP